MGVQISIQTIYHRVHIQQRATDMRRWIEIWTLFSQHVEAFSKPKTCWVNSRVERHYRPQDQLDHFSSLWSAIEPQLSTRDCSRMS